jgi:hypothetical protein
MNTDPTYLPVMAKLLAETAQAKGGELTEVQWNNAVHSLMPANGKQYRSKLISMAKKLIPNLKCNKSARKQAARERRKKKLKKKESANNKTIISAMVVSADKIWTPDLAMMNYQDFLATPYWKLIREIKLKQCGFHCSRCQDARSLQIHHTTYAHRGSEHRHLYDLRVLCSGCHKFTHKL